MKLIRGGVDVVEVDCNGGSRNAIKVGSPGTPVLCGVLASEMPVSNASKANGIRRTGTILVFKITQPSGLVQVPPSSEPKHLSRTRIGDIGNA